MCFLRLIEVWNLKSYLTDTFKFIGLSCILDGSFTHAWFCNIMLWSFRKYKVTEYALLLNMDIFHYVIPKTTFGKSPCYHRLIRKVSNVRVLELKTVANKFARLPVLAWKVSWSLAADAGKVRSVKTTWIGRPRSLPSHLTLMCNTCGCYFVTCHPECLIDMEH